MWVCVLHQLAALWVMVTMGTAPINVHNNNNNTKMISQHNDAFSIEVLDMGFVCDLAEQIVGFIA